MPVLSCCSFQGQKNSSGRAATRSRFPWAQALVNQPLHYSTTVNEHQPRVFGLRVFFPALLCLEVAQKHHGNSLWSLLEMQACKAGWNEFCPRMNGSHIRPKVTGLIEDNIWRGEVSLTTAQCPGLEKHWAQTHRASLLNWAQWTGHMGIWFALWQLCSSAGTWNKYLPVCMLTKQQGLCRHP